ncbi:phosphatase 2C-like domain-containing protein [Umbelopsis sp. PMI_123]|nr:phosphatase 2C-like domain-containing protein [Umbelopsis sp. PMI_123]
MIQQKRAILLQSYYKHLLYRSKAGPAIAIYPTQHNKTFHSSSSHPAAVRSIPAKDNVPIFSSSTSSSILSLYQQTAPYSALYEPLQPRIPTYDNTNHLSIVDYFDPAYVPHKPAYIFNHAASGFAKQGRTVCIAPEDSACYFSVQVGEDSYFKRYNALGVADGANPALYSRKLMHYAYLEMEQLDLSSTPTASMYSRKIDPVEILQRSYDKSTQDAKHEGIVGSSTACVVVLGNDELKIANLGDCGLSVIRHNNFVFRTEEQQHSFNFPYQLGTGSFDSPQDAQQFTVKVEKGDIIILASDGLFDNLFDEDILEIVCEQVAPKLEGVLTTGPDLPEIDPQAISDALALRAKRVSEDNDNGSSPFQTRAMKEGMYYQGGKADDISVLVAIIKDVS